MNNGLLTQRLNLSNYFEGSIFSALVITKETCGLFKNVQMQGAQKTEPRGVYRYTLSGAVCSATQQMSVFQQSLPRIQKT
jgi:hypothetical protein